MICQAEDVNPEWLTAVLKRAGVLERARITAVKIQPVDVDKGVTGQLSRMRIGYDLREPGAPRSLIAKSSAPDPRARAFFHSMGFYEREVRFYREIAPHAELRTPRCYYSAIDGSSGRFLLILEDLGTGSGSLIAGCSATEAERGVRAISTFHAAWWQHPRTRRTAWLKLSSHLSADQAPGVFRTTWQPFLNKLTPDLRDESERAGPWLNAHVGDLHSYIYRAGPHTLIHNDFHPENLLFLDDGTSAAAVLDWQVPTFGRGVLDVALLLGDLNALDRRAQELRLLRLYHVLLARHGVRDYTFRQCWTDYRLAMLFVITRISMAVGYGGIPPERDRELCEIVLPRYLAAVRDIEAYRATESIDRHG